MQSRDLCFSEVIYPYTAPESVDVITRNKNLYVAKVLFKNDENPYLLMTKPCTDHLEKATVLQTLCQQHQCSHPAIMPLSRLTISPNNSIEAYFNYPENGKLSDYIGFAHERFDSEKNVLTPTQKSIIAYGLAHALQYIHQQGYQFGDLNAKNVFLDSNFYPYLSNFYSLKKIDDKRYPQEKRITKMHQKVDVYAYSIIYAALIEPVLFDPPVSNSKEFFENLSSHKRPVCKLATKEQRKVLDKMWDYIPRDRIDFNKVLKYFERGDLLFPETDKEAFEDYKNKLMAYSNLTLSAESSSPSRISLSAASSASNSTFTSPSKTRSPSPKPSPKLIRKLSHDIIKNEDDSD